MTDPISDMLARIRNAVAVGRSSVILPHSKIKEDVAKALVESGFLYGVKVKAEAKFKELEIQINEEAQSPKITEIKRLSSPGRRQYVKAANLPKVKRGRGMVVISTSIGVMDAESARAKNLGGELICEVF